MTGPPTCDECRTGLERSTAASRFCRKLYRRFKLHTRPGISCLWNEPVFTAHRGILFLRGMGAGGFYPASRIASTVVAGAATLLTVAWGLPVFPIPMPSWYNLFLATFGAVAVFQYLDTEKRRWLFFAGLFGGASFLVKIIGLYYVAAVLLFLIFREQLVHRSEESGKGAASILYRIFVTGSLLLFLAFVIYLVRPPTQRTCQLHLIIPAAAVVAVLLSRERFHSSATSTQRFSFLLRTLLPFLGGVLIPIGMFLLPYLMSGTSNEFFKGVFAAGMARNDDLR